MKIIHQSYDILTPISPYGTYELEFIEKAARTCYKSENKILDQAESAKKLIATLIKNGHEAMLEHSILSVKFTCDRAIANELVRHRMASFAQESTRYCNYSDEKFNSEITVIKPEIPGKEALEDWKALCQHAEKVYNDMIMVDGYSPQIARCVLPLSLKTEIVVTANYREWRHILRLRTAENAHPQIRNLMRPLLTELTSLIPIVFDDIYREVYGE